MAENIETSKTSDEIHDEEVRRRLDYQKIPKKFKGFPEITDKYDNIEVDEEE